MSILYYLQDLPITPDPNDRSGRVKARGSLNESDVLDRMIKRGTGISREDMQATLDLFTEETGDLVAEGWNVNTRLANFRPGVRGVFSSATDPFDHRRHHFQASISEGVVLKKKMRETSGERITAPKPIPGIIEFMDHGSRMVSGSLTPGSIGELTGEALKFNLENKKEGIFFVNKADNVTTKATVISILTEGKLMFQIPAGLTPGSYRLEVRRAYTNEKTIRAGVLSDTLIVG